MEKKHTVLCRVGFCQACYDRDRPQKGQRFVTIGRGRQRYLIREVKRIGQRGFTPQIIERISTTNGKVEFHSYCAMENCGVVFIKKNDEFELHTINEVVKILSVKDWNALVNYTGDKQYLLD